MCFSLQEADAIISAADKAKTVGQVGYMKVYDPAHELAHREVRDMDAIRFVQVNHLHPDNDLHLRQFRVRRFDDLPSDAMEMNRLARKAALREAIGDVSSDVERAFFTLAGSMIHDIYGLRVMLGQPSRVVGTEIWNEGRAITTTLEYPGGARCVATWVDLPKVWDFKETLEVYGDAKRVIVSYPTGFARGILSSITIEGIDKSGRSYRKEPTIEWESAFVRELRHFHECITGTSEVRTSVASARDDISLIIEIVKRYLGGDKREVNR
jgi:predicted dehydrogenase